MKNRKLTFALLALSVSFTAAMAQNRVPEAPDGGMIRSGLASPIYSELKRVHDPKGGTTYQMEPYRREAGYWPDMPQGSDQQQGVVLLHFIKGTTIFDRSYDNERSLAMLDDTFYNPEILKRIEFLTVTAAASPEGTTFDNEKLAAGRALAIKEYLLSRFPYLDRDRILTYSAGEDWHGLRRMIEEDIYTPGRDEALDMLGAPLPVKILRERLQKAAGGETWRYISDNMFPSLRGGASCMIYFTRGEQIHESESEVVVTPLPGPTPVGEDISWPAPLQTPESEPKSASAPVTLNIGTVEVGHVVFNRRLNMGTVEVGHGEPNRRGIEESWFDLKTNLLYDATATINLGLEVRLSNRLSFDFPVSYNAWDFSSIRKWRHILVQPEFRLWTLETFRGHFFGVHGHYASYNIGNLPFTPYMKEHRFQGTLMGFGVSWGYRWGFRNPRWGMEATLGAGYARLQYDEMVCETCGEAPAPKKVVKHWIGPTKVGLSLIYRMGGKRK